MVKSRTAITKKYLKGKEKSQIYDNQEIC